MFALMLSEPSALPANESSALPANNRAAAANLALEGSSDARCVTFVLLEETKEKRVMSTVWAGSSVASTSPVRSLAASTSFLRVQEFVRHELLCRDL